MPKMKRPMRVTPPEYRIRRNCRISPYYTPPREVVTYEPQRKRSFLLGMIYVYVTINDGAEYSDIHEAWRAISRDRRRRAKGSTEIVGELWPEDPIPDEAAEPKWPPLPTSPSKK